MRVMAPSVRESAGEPSGSQTGSAAARAGCGHRRCPQALRWHAPLCRQVMPDSELADVHRYLAPTSAPAPLKNIALLNFRGAPL